MREGIRMNVKKEMDFLRAISLGLFNKKGVAFNLSVRPFDEGKQVQILIVNGDTPGHGNVLRLHITYRTNVDRVFLRLHIDSAGRSGFNEDWVNKEVPKAQAVESIKEMLHYAKDKADNKFSRYNGEVDYYTILSNLSKEIFVDEDLFELEAWSKGLHLRDVLKVPYNSLTRTYFVTGGIGGVANHNALHSATTTVEFGYNPQDSKSYLGVIKSINPNPKIPQGLHPNATIDMFAYSVLEQFKGAWTKQANRSN